MDTEVKVHGGITNIMQPHYKGVFKTMCPSTHWLPPAPLSRNHVLHCCSFQTNVTLDTAKVSQFLCHNAVHEPVISNVQAPQYISMFPYLVHSIL